MPGRDLDARLASTFAALGEPELTADRRGSLGPALRRRRARRHRLASALGLALVVAGLAAGLPLGLRSAPAARPAASATPATCLEVQVGGGVSCRGSIVSSVHSGNLTVPSFAAAAPLGAARSAAPGGSRPVGVAVGARLVISLPADRGVQWSPVVVAPAADNSAAPLASAGATPGASVRVSTARMRTTALAVVVALAPGLVTLEAHGRSICTPGKSGCVVRSVTWRWEFRVVPVAPSAG